jgi:hypothetical protein
LIPYEFGHGMKRQFPHNPFARYADDGVVHSRSEARARYPEEPLERRFRGCMLELHPEKTRIVCCVFGNQQHTQASRKSDYPGYCFRPRLVRTRYGKLFLNPIIAKKAYRRSGASPRFAPGAVLLQCCARTSLTVNSESIMKYSLPPGKSWGETRFQG